MTTPITKDHLTQALAKALCDCAPESNRTGWMKRLADDIGAGDKSVQAWTYGEYPPEPEMLMTLFLHFGRDFANKVLVLAGLISANLDDAELIDAANALAAYRTMATQIDGVMRDARAKDPKRAGIAA